MRKNLELSDTLQLKRFKSHHYTTHSIPHCTLVTCRFERPLTEHENPVKTALKMAMVQAGKKAAPSRGIKLAKSLKWLTKV